MLATLVAASHPSFGQAGPPHYPSTARSDAWMDSVRRLPLSAQVAAVRARVLADTVLRHPRQFVCFTPVSAASREAYDRAQRPRLLAEAARPLGVLLLYKLGGHSLTDNSPAQTAVFLQELEARRVRRITFLKSGAPAAAIYGGLGGNGVVLLEAAHP